MIEETAERGDVALTNFAQHPADCLVHQIVGISECALSKREQQIWLPDAHECPGRQHGDPALPEARRAKESLEPNALLGVIEQVRAQDSWRGSVDQVPVVERASRREQHPVDARAARLVAPFELANEDQHRGQAMFVHGTLQEGTALGEGERSEDARYLALQWHADAEEAIPFSVFARAGPEEPS
jgi:hypothetical protein